MGSLDDILSQHAQKTTPPVDVEFIEFQWRRKHSDIVGEIRAHLEGAKIIFQLEQGIDYLMPPGRRGIHVLHA